MALHEVGKGKKKKVLNDEEYGEYRSEHSELFGCFCFVFALVSFGGSFYLTDKVFGSNYKTLTVVVSIILAVLIYEFVKKVVKAIFF